SKAVAAARNLEALGRAGNLADAASSLRALESEFTILQQELNLIQSAPDPGNRQPSKPHAARGDRSRR
ncbi:MAG: hypothetical protein WBY38_05245, partial [Candidatus Acidiferrales bacterium]